MTEDEMVGWHHRLNEHEFEQTPRDNKDQRNVGCCSQWGHKESGKTEQLNNSKNPMEPCGGGSCEETGLPPYPLL